MIETLKVELVTTDDRFYSACRKVLLKFQEVQWNLSIVDHSAAGDADLCLWDYESEPSLTGAERIPNQKKVYVVSRRNLAKLQDQLRGKPARVLLKPVSPIIFKTLISEMVASVQHRKRVDGEKGLDYLQHDRDEMLQYLLECNLRIQEYDQARNVFLAYGIHDLRAPITSILGYAKLLLDGQVGRLSTEQSKVIELVQQSAQRSYRLTNSILQTSVNDSTEIQPRLQAGNPGEVVAQAVSELAPLTEARNVKIQAEILPPTIPLKFDPSLILQVLVNLLDNSCRLTPKGGRVSVRGFPIFWDRRASNVGEPVPRRERRSMSVNEPNAYRLEVWGSGPEFQTADLEKVFDDYRSPSEQQDRERGAHWGLGLSACRQIIDLHFGDIFTQPGKSSCFVVVLPYLSEDRHEISGIRRVVDRATYANPVG